MRSKIHLVASVVLSSVSLFMSGCGGGSIPLPQPDFNISVSSAAIPVVMGTYSSPVSISIGALNGFTGSVTVAISGLPPGSVTSPAAPFQVRSSRSQQVTFFVPVLTAAGPVTIQLDGSSASLSHSSVLTLQIAQGPDTADLQDGSGQAPAGTIEIQGLSAGVFDPTYWQDGTLNWVPDVRAPMFPALTTGPNQNIYAPWAIEQTTGWRMFYGGWDGTPSPPHDQIYSVTTSDFLSFQNRTLVIGNGAFYNVNNVNVQVLPDASMHMICTAEILFPADFPSYFSSPDGVTWNGSPQPYQAQLTDIVDIQGYPGYQTGSFNAGNVLLRDNDSWVLYFYDNNNNGQIFRAVGDSPLSVQLTGIALETGHDPNDVKKFVVGSQSWYLMGLMSNAPQLWYSLSNDGVTFQREQTLFFHQSPQDTNMVSLNFVTKGNQVLGVLYGADGTPDLTGNQIFGRWLQKQVILIDSAGSTYAAQGSYGPDRQWFQAPGSGSFQGTMVVLAEDGVTAIGSGSVTLSAGKSYRLSLP
jgi:hypothetical protein